MLLTSVVHHEDSLSIKYKMLEGKAAQFIKKMLQPSFYTRYAPKKLDQHSKLYLDPSPKAVIIWQRSDGIQVECCWCFTACGFRLSFRIVPYNLPEKACQSVNRSFQTSDAYFWLQDASWSSSLNKNFSLAQGSVPQSFLYVTYRSKWTRYSVSAGFEIPRSERENHAMKPETVLPTTPRRALYI